MTTLTKPTARAASTALAFEHASDFAASADNAIKRMCDIIASLIGIILLTPVSIIVAAMVRLHDGGPAFFKQERVGLDGTTFTMFKFRTMHVDAEAMKASLAEANEADASAGNSVMFKMANDPRVTRIGAFLRKTSIDELPQLFNVLRGDMSLVGPRPPLPSEVAQYEPRVMAFQPFLGRDSPPGPVLRPAPFPHARCVDRAADHSRSAAPRGSLLILSACV